MEQLLEWMEIIEDVRQQRKVRHCIKDILAIVLFCNPCQCREGTENTSGAVRKVLSEFIKNRVYTNHSCSVSTDYLIYTFLGKMGIEYQTKTIFGLLVTIWFVINELLSVLENAGRMGAVLPKFLKNILSELQKDIEDYDDNSKK